MNDASISLAAPQMGRRALEALVIDNPDLERLEGLLDQFNIFEAIGAVRHELRHSDFLAFLLNPQQNHGLGDAFLKRLLQKVLLAASNAPLPLTLIDLDVWDLDETTVLREWRNIDILMLNESHQLAVIIENKIGSSEHSGQLRRYRNIVHQHYPQWNIVGLYLTPDGDQPSDEAYLPVDYGLVCVIIEGFTASRASTLGADVLMMMRHYAQMLRRHILSESEIAELCQRIYHKHQRALDMIYEHRPDRQMMIRDVLANLIQQQPDLILDSSSKNGIRFTLCDWDQAPALQEGQGRGWTPSGRVLLFEFTNALDSLALKLIIGPGPQDTRQKLFDMALHSPPLFKAANKLFTKWNLIYQRSILTAPAYDEASATILTVEIEKQWKKFLENDLPAIAEVIKAQQWLWQS